MHDLWNFWFKYYIECCPLRWTFYLWQEFFLLQKMPSCNRKFLPATGNFFLQQEISSCDRKFLSVTRNFVLPEEISSCDREGPFRFCHLAGKTKSLKLELYLKWSILKCWLAVTEPLWFLSLCQMLSFRYNPLFDNFVFPSKWQNLIGPKTDILLVLVCVCQSFVKLPS